MKYYDFSLIQNNQLVGEGYGTGSNALDAFENAVQAGTVLLPANEHVEVAALSESGLGIKFEAHRF